MPGIESAGKKTKAVRGKGPKERPGPGKSAESTVQPSRESEELLPQGLFTSGFSPDTINRNAALLGYSRRSRPTNALVRTQIMAKLQRDYGNQYVQRLVERLSKSSSEGLQTKLEVSSPGDESEQEADRVAKQVMREISSGEGTAQRQEEEFQTKPLGIHRQEEEESEDTETHQVRALAIHRQVGKLQMKPLAQPQTGAAGGDIEQAIKGARGSGHALPDQVRRPMERVFGADFSGVRVHTDKRANDLNDALSAHAFTTGQDIFFRQGNYNPGRRSGQELLAHELTHVVQQGGVQRSRLSPSTGSDRIQRVGPAAPAVMGAAEWIALGTAGYTVAQDAVSGTAGDVSYTFDEMEGVLLPGGGSNVEEYRNKYPNANIRTYRHVIAVWRGDSDSRKIGIKFGLTFSYDGHAIGNISCDILETYDWPGWAGSVNVNFTPVSLARGDVSKVRITINVNYSRTLLGGKARSVRLELDATGLLQTIGGRVFVRFNE